MNSNIFYQLINLKRCYTEAFNEVSKKYDLTQNEIDIILFLYNHPQNNNSKDIVEMRNIKKSNVSKAIDLLTEKKYLKQETSEKDKRVIDLFLNNEYDNVFQELSSIQLKVLNKIFKGITDEEIKVIDEVINKIITNAGENKCGLKY